MGWGFKLAISGLFAGVGAGIGTLAGNPVLGAKLGWMVGGAAGNYLDADGNDTGVPVVRTPSKLELEKVGNQISTYGADIQSLYGSSRIQGNIIWAGPQTQSLSTDKSEYNASVSFAIALTDGSIDAIAKVWADDTLIIDLTDTSHSGESGMTFYDGTQTSPDPLISSIELEGTTPIYKNISYVVFKDFDLQDFSNKIPTIEFEAATDTNGGLVRVPDLDFGQDGNLYPTCTTIFSGDIYVAYSEKEYNASGYSTPKIKKMVGLSTDIDYEFDVDVQTIKSFKIINGIKIITAPIDFVLDVGATGIENDITNYDGSILHINGTLIKKINFSDRKTSETTWFPQTSFEKDVTELNGFITNGIEFIDDNLWVEDSWLDAILRNEYTDKTSEEISELVNNEGFIVAMGQRWWFDTNNEWPEIDPLDSWSLIGKEHLYSEGFIKVYDSNGVFIGEQSTVQTIDALQDYKTLDYLSFGIDDYTVSSSPHYGYLDVHVDYSHRASGYRYFTSFFGEWAKDTIEPVPSDWVLPNTNNNSFEILSCFYLSEQQENIRKNSAVFMWLTVAIETEDDPHSENFGDAETIYMIHFFNASDDDFSSPNKKGGSKGYYSDVQRSYWDVTNLFDDPHTIINMTYHYIDGLLFVTLLADNGTSKTIKEDSTASAGYSEPKYNTFDINDVSISSITADLLERSGITNYDLTQIDDIFIGGYLRDKTTTPAFMIKSLMLAFSFDIIEVDWELRAVIRSDVVDVVLDEDYISASEETSENDMIELMFDKSELPNVVNVSFIDSTRDYNANTRLSQWVTRTTNNELDIKLPFVITPTQAKQIAEKQLQFLWNTRSSFSFSTTIRYIYLTPNDVITLGNKTMRISNVGFDIPNRLRIQAIEIRAGVFESESTSIDNPDAQEKPNNTLSDVSYILVHTHSLRRDNDGGYYIAVFSLKTWGGAGVYIGDTGQNMNIVAKIEDESDVGLLLQPIDKAVSTTTFDYGTTINVAFNKAPANIRTVGENTVLGGKNMIAIGSGNKWELVSYQTATLVSGNTYNLSGLIRGVRGTDIYDHSHDEGVYVIPIDSLTHVSVENAQVEKYLYMKVLPPIFGTTNTYMKKVFAPGDMLDVWGASDINAMQYGDKTWRITWKFRTRVNGEWNDYEDIVDIDTATRFIVEFINPFNSVEFYRYYVDDLLYFDYDEATQIANWGTYVSEIEVKIYQYNDYSEVASDSFSFIGDF